MLTLKPRNSCYVVVALFISLFFGSARAENVICSMIAKGQIPMDREIETVRVLDQGCVPNCWLASYTSLVELEVKKKTGQSIPISLGYLMKQDLRSKSFWYLKGAKSDIEIGDHVSTGDWLAREYGLMPDSQFTPLTSTSTWDTDKWIAEIKTIISLNRSRRLTDDQIWMLVDTYIHSKTGAHQDQFLWNGQSMTPTDFAKEYVNFKNSKKHFYQFVLKGYGRGHKSTHGDTRTIEQLEHQALEFLKGGHAVLFSFRVPRPLFNSSTGVVKDDNERPMDAPDRHAMIVTGYLLDMDGKVLAWKTQNSWGEGKGQKGIYYLSGEFVHRYVEGVALYGNESN